MYINGQFTSGSASEQIEVINPATEDVLDQVSRGLAQDAEAAVQAARKAFDGWRRVPASGTGSNTAPDFRRHTCQARTTDGIADPRGRQTGPRK